MAVLLYVFWMFGEGGFVVRYLYSYISSRWRADCIGMRWSQDVACKLSALSRLWLGSVYCTDSEFWHSDVFGVAHYPGDKRYKIFYIGQTTAVSIYKNLKARRPWAGYLSQSRISATRVSDKKQTDKD